MNLELVTRFLFSDRYATDRPTFEKVISANTQLIVVLVFMLGIFFIGRYLIGEKIFGKGKGWKAIIPFYGAYELSRTVSLNPALAITLFIPVVGIIPFSIFNFILPKAFAKDFKMQLFCLFFPLIAYIVIGVDKNFEYQYQKGKNIAFKNDFKTILPH